MKVKLIDTILLALMTALLMIAGHQIYVTSKIVGFKAAVISNYYIFMILFILTVWYQIRKNKEKAKQDSDKMPPKGPNKSVKGSIKGKKRAK
jgi:hypothetical protein